ncbi:MAG TPA: DUF1175 family protein [Spirochaetota bacterium]|nr:DUF1175 family protein [Spirochaetota bacterium]
MPGRFLLLILSAALVLSCGAGCGHEKSTLTSSVTRFPADGVSGGSIRAVVADGAVISGPAGRTDAIEIVAREKDSGADVIFFKSTGRPGTVTYRTSDGAVLHLTFFKNDSDIDGDGFPDVIELSSEDDRAAFRRWFVRIAQSQFLKRNASWNNRERDCAGLIRYSYREALKKHDERWIRRSGIVIDKNIPDVKTYSYPDIPLVGERIFKIKDGEASDLKSFGDFADAATIALLNAFPVSRNLADAESGDILIFRFEENGEYPYHTMIVDREDGNSVKCIYHTGTADLIKRVDPSYLAGSPYEPSAQNRRFLGVYRFHILE